MVLVISVIKKIFPVPLAKITNAIHQDMARKIIPIIPTEMNVSIMKKSGEYRIEIMSRRDNMKAIITGVRIIRTMFIS